jgi:hypothetical protein
MIRYTHHVNGHLDKANYLSLSSSDTLILRIEKTVVEVAADWPFYYWYSFNAYRTSKIMENNQFAWRMRRINNNSNFLSARC